MKKEIKCLRAPAAVGAYSQGIESSGFVFLFGAITNRPRKWNNAKRSRKASRTIFEECKKYT